MSDNELETYNEQVLAYHSGDMTRAGELAHWTPEQRLQGAELLVQGFESASGVLVAASNASAEIAKCLRDIEIASMELETMLSLRLSQMDISIEKFKESLPMIERTVDKQCDQIEAILQRVLEIDVDGCSDATARHRSELISLCGTKSQQLNEILMKFLSM